MRKGSRRNKDGEKAKKKLRKIEGNIRPVQLGTQN